MLSWNSWLYRGFLRLSPSVCSKISDDWSSLRPGYLDERWQALPAAYAGRRRRWRGDGGWVGDQGRQDGSSGRAGCAWRRQGVWQEALPARQDCCRCWTWTFWRPSSCLFQLFRCFGLLHDPSSIANESLSTYSFPCYVEGEQRERGPWGRSWTCCRSFGELEGHCVTNDVFTCLLGTSKKQDWSSAEEKPIEQFLSIVNEWMIFF